jgi:hypothetical protein
VLLVLTCGLVALPFALAWLVRAEILTPGQLLTGLLHFDERYLPLWALVAGSVVWSDAEPEHRPLLLAWPVRPWELALAKALAVGLGYGALVATAAAGLPTLLAQATGGAIPRQALPADLLLVRALLPAAVLMALASIGSQTGSPWLGLALGGALWLLNLLDPAAIWLDETTGGALHLFAWTRGSCVPLGVANGRTALVALALHGAALWAPGLARSGLRRPQKGQPLSVEGQAEGLTESLHSGRSGEPGLFSCLRTIVQRRKVARDVLRAARRG